MAKNNHVVISSDALHKITKGLWVTETLDELKKRGKLVYIGDNFLEEFYVECRFSEDFCIGYEFSDEFYITILDKTPIPVNEEVYQDLLKRRMKNRMQNNE